MINLAQELRTCWNEKNYLKGIDLLEKEDKLNPLLKTFYALNTAQTPLSKDTQNLPLEKRKFYYFQSNRTQEGIETQLVQFKNRMPFLTEEHLDQIKKKWDRTLSHPFTNSSFGKNCMAEKIEMDIYQIPENHKRIFSNFHLASKLSSDHYLKKHSHISYYEFVAFLSDLKNDLPENKALSVFIDEITRASENEYYSYRGLLFAAESAPVISKELKLPEKEVGETDETLLIQTIAPLYKENLEKIQSLQPGETMFMLGGWRLENSMHAIGYIVTHLGNDHFSLTFVDGQQDLGVAMGWRKQEKGRINPFLTLSPIAGDKIRSPEFHLSFMRMNSPSSQPASQRTHIQYFMNIFGVDKNAYKPHVNSFRPQREGTHICQMKTITMMLKHSLISEGGKEAKKTMFALKAKSLLRFQKSCQTESELKYDKEAQKILAMAIEKYRKRIRKFDPADRLALQKDFSISI